MRHQRSYPSCFSYCVEQATSQLEVSYPPITLKAYTAYLDGAMLFILHHPL